MKTVIKLLSWLALLGLVGLLVVYAGPLQLRTAQAVGVAADLLADLRLLTQEPDARMVLPVVQQVETPETVFVDDDFDSTTDGWGVTHFAIIQDGVEAVADGGLVQVAEGAYVEQVFVAKDLSLQGADRASILQSPLKLRDCFSTNGKNNAMLCIQEGATVTVAGFTLDGMGNGNRNNRFYGIAFHNSGGSVLNNAILDVRNTPLSGAKHGTAVFALNDDGIERSISVLDNTLSGFQYAGINLSASPAASIIVDIQGNQISGATTGSLAAAYGIQIQNGSGLILENTIQDTRNAILLSDRAGLDDSLEGEIADTPTSTSFEIARNKLIMGVGDPLKAAGLQVESGFGASDLGLNVHHNQVSGFGLGMGFMQCVADCGAGALTNLDIISNDLLQNNTAITLDGALAAPLNLHHNRIYGPGLVGLQNRLLTSVPAMDNWWGCNDGPGMEGCTLLVGPAEVEPWLVLSVAANPPLIRPAGSAVVTADLVHNSAGVDTRPQGTLRDGVLVGFSAPDGGEITPLECALLDGAASASFLAPEVEQVFQVYARLDSVLVYSPVTVDSSAVLAVDDDYSTPEDELLSTSASGVLANDYAGEGAVLTSRLESGTLHGELLFNTDGSFSYLPAPNWYGVDSFTYSFTDGTAESNTATVMLTVNPAYDAYLAVDDSYFTDEEIPLVVTVLLGVLANDQAGDGNTAQVLVQSEPEHGELVLQDNGAFTYTPAANFFGADGFTYLVADGISDSNLATVSITVNPINDAPLAFDLQLTTDEDVPLPVALLAVDVDEDPLTWTVSEPAHGVLSGTAPDLLYTPELDWNGEDQFSYSVSDGLATSSDYTVTITVLEAYVPPQISAPDLAVPFTQGVQQEFTIQLNNPLGGDLHPAAQLDLRFAETTLDEISSLQVYDNATEQWLAFELIQEEADLVGVYGPQAGFALAVPDTHSLSMRVIFNTIKIYPLTLSLMDLTNADEPLLLASLEQAVLVVEPPPSLIFLPQVLYEHWSDNE